MTDSDAVVISTEWEEFKTIDYAKGFEVMKKPAYCFDGRLMINREELEDIGFIVETIGY
jgi:UDPglucose 6-dehydrogenase